MTKISISHGYFTFLHSFWLTIPKTLGISYDKGTKDVFCYVNEMAFGKPLDNLRMGGWFARRNDQVIQMFEVSVLLPAYEERGWILNQPMANDLVNRNFNGTSIKTQTDWVQRASRMVNTWRCGENGPPGKLHTLSLYPAQCISSGC